MAIDTTTAEEKLALAAEVGMDPIFIPLMEIALMPVTAGPMASLHDWRLQMERWVSGEAKQEYQEALRTLYELKARGLYDGTMELLRKNTKQAIQAN